MKNITQLLIYIAMFAVVAGGAALVYSSAPYSSYGIKSGAEAASVLPLFQVGSVAGNMQTETLSLESGYPLYLCGAAANQTFAGSNPFSWTSDSSAGYDYGGIGSSIGHQSDNACTASAGRSGSLVGKYGIAMTGIGLDWQPGSYSLYTSPTSLAPGIDEVIYSVSAPGSFVVIMASVGGGGKLNPPLEGPLESVTLPSGCTAEEYINNADTAESSYIAVCESQGVGTYTSQFEFEQGTDASFAVYVMGPQATTSTTSTSTTTSITSTSTTSSSTSTSTAATTSSATSMTSSRSTTSQPSSTSTQSSTSASTMQTSASTTTMASSTSTVPSTGCTTVNIGNPICIAISSNSSGCYTSVTECSGNSSTTATTSTVITTTVPQGCTVVSIANPICLSISANPNSCYTSITECSSGSSTVATTSTVYTTTVPQGASTTTVPQGCTVVSIANPICLSISANPNSCYTSVEECS
ncbi:MAG: hypothetical protein ACREBH_00350 [Candidatus Micrarchaeaceae archaeon]